MSDAPEVAAPQTLDNGKPIFCKGCAHENATCVTRGIWDKDARLTFVLETPDPMSAEAGTVGKGRDGNLLRRFMHLLSDHYKEQLPGGKLPYSTVYAVGHSKKPNAVVLNQCSSVWKSQWLSNYATQEGPHVLVPLGLPAAKSIGVSARKILDIRGRSLQTMLNMRQVGVVPTLSLATAFAKPGLAKVMLEDVKRAVRMAYLNEVIEKKPIEELAKGYRFPKTIEEVRELCQYILDYYDPEKQPGPMHWPITVDTETNTLKTYKRDARILMVSFGWNDGKSAAILLDHPENTWYDPKEAWREVARILESPKPKTFHNLKYDGTLFQEVYKIKLNNVTWDTMCGEHWLSEDQKGIYGLKPLATLYCPTYEGYEDTLHQVLRGGEESVPTEEDVAKEAKELAAASGNTMEWYEGFSDEPEEEEEEERDPNEVWRADPTWPDGIDPDLIAQYKTYREEWFKLDAEGNGKLRGIVWRRWKTVANKIGVAEPHPVPEKKETDKGDNGFEDITLEKLLPYAAADTDVTRLIMKGQYRKLHATEADPADAQSVMEGLYIPGSLTLGRLEFRGVKVDLDKARRYDSELSVILTQCETRIWDLATERFNINASKQLANMLVRMGFRQSKKTANGSFSTDKGVIAQYQLDMVNELRRPDITEQEKADATRKLDFVEAVLLYRAAHKMKTSFLRNLREYAALDGHIHTTFHITGTSTGRLSSARLNLQNLPLYMCHITRPNLDDPENPVVVHEGFNVKALLVPETEDEVFWNLDIKAAEIRVACYYSGDKDLIKAVSDGLDVHTFFLTKIKHPTLQGAELEEKYKHYKALVDAEDHEITKFRTAIKRVVFGTLYGAGPGKIAAQIGAWCTKEFAQQIIDSLFTAFPGLRKYIDETKKEVRQRGRVRTVFGRFRRFFMAAVSPEMKSKAEREAVNFKIQSTSSDLVVAQLCEIDEHLHEIEGTLRLTVHDSMAGTIKKNRVKEMKAFFDKWLVERIKERFPWMPVPFLYDLEIGPSYGEKMKYKDYIKQLEAQNAA